MKIGEVVEMKSAVLQFGTPKYRSSMTMKAVKGRQLVFIYLGARDVTQDDTPEPINFSAREVLRRMGWIPGPELQAMFDAEKAEPK